MNLPNNDNTDFDRLVDGELSPDDRRLLLASLDKQPDGWRRCALAFLEAQTWSGQLKQWKADPYDDIATPVSRKQREIAAHSKYSWLALAAGLLLAFTLGWSAHTRNGIHPQQEQIAGKGQQVTADDVVAERVSEDDAVTFMLCDTCGRHRRIQVPLMDLENLEPQFTNTLPEEVRQRFQHHGLDLQRRRRYAPMFFQQNEQFVPMVVPVDDTFVVPVNQQVY